MNIYRKRGLFRRHDQSNVYRMFFWIILILGGIWLVRSLSNGDIKQPFEAPPTPTRFAVSYALEGDAQFTAGKVEDAITAYREAVKGDPSNAQLLAQLARIQIYSSAMLVKDDTIRARLAEGLESAKQAVDLAPDDSFTHAIYAFALDWNANPTLINDDREIQKLLSKANEEATRAQQLDPNNTLTLAFFAEILVDQQKWSQAEQYIQQALDRDSSIMDVHRVHAYVLESLGEYALAIEAYDRAITITPNLTFLYLRAGANYRRLAFDSPNETVQTELYEKSLEYFDKTATINKQLDIEDPVPYLSIARTYSQMGQFFVAIRNVQKTIEFEPDNPVLYGELGVLYHKNRNYETGILALECAVRGCTAEQSCPARGDCGLNDVEADVVGLPLSASTIYYYDIYASELAALGPQNDNYCPRALEIATEIEASEFDSDPNIAADLVVVRNLCSSTPDIGIDTNATLEPVVLEGTPTATP